MVDRFEGSHYYLAQPFRPAFLMRTHSLLSGMLRFGLYAALCDLGAGIKRTGLGPLWSTIGIIALVAILGLFFGTVLKQQLPDFEDYIPHLTAGLIAWTFLASSVHQSCHQVWAFLNALRHARMTLLVPVLRAMIGTSAILVLNLIVALAVAWLYFGTVATSPLLLLCGILLLVANAFWISHLSALLCARFRDMPQLVAWGLHLAFFLTPILWMEYNLGRFEYLLWFNPFHYLVTIIRAPLLGLPAVPGIWLGAILMAALGNLACWSLARLVARRLPYWL